jgi:glutathione synthase/RimK-type ligase-like ATP-grasp enzyme
MNRLTQEEWRQSHISHVMQALGITRKDYKRFLIIGNKLHRINENQCNGYQDINGNWDQAASDAEEIIEEQLKNKATQMAKELGLYIFFQTDPRGATIYLDKEEIPYNNYTNAYCIY